MASRRRLFGMLGSSNSNSWSKATRARAGSVAFPPHRLYGLGNTPSEGEERVTKQGGKSGLPKEVREHLADIEAALARAATGDLDAASSLGAATEAALVASR